MVVPVQITDITGVEAKINNKDMAVSKTNINNNDVTVDWDDDDWSYYNDLSSRLKMVTDGMVKKNDLSKFKKY